MTLWKRFLTYPTGRQGFNFIQTIIFSRQPEQTFPFGHTPTETPPTGMPHFPIDPLILRAAFGPFFPFPIPSQANFFPTFSSSQALIALASKKQRPSQHEENIPSG